MARASPPCGRCGGNIRPYHSPGERQAEPRCSMCGHEPAPTDTPIPPPAPERRREKYVPKPEPPRRQTPLQTTGETPARPTFQDLGHAAIQARIAPRREKVAALFQADTWPLDIAHQLDVAPEVVYADLIVLGLSPGKRRIDEHTKQQIISMRKAHLPAAEIVRELGVSNMTIRRHAGQAGILSRRQREQSRRLVGIRLLRRYRPECSYSDIAEIVGVHRGTVRNWAVAEGLQQGDPARHTGATDKATQAAGALSVDAAPGQQGIRYFAGP